MLPAGVFVLYDSSPPKTNSPSCRSSGGYNLYTMKMVDGEIAPLPTCFTPLALWLLLPSADLALPWLYKAEGFVKAGVAGISTLVLARWVELWVLWLQHTAAVVTVVPRVTPAFFWSCLESLKENSTLTQCHGVLSDRWKP